MSEVLLTRVPVLAHDDTIMQRITVANNPRFVFIVPLLVKFRLLLWTIGQLPEYQFFMTCPPSHFQPEVSRKRHTHATRGWASFSASRNVGSSSGSQNQRCDPSPEEPALYARSVQAGLSGPWKRIGVSRATFEHNFSAPHHDSVESFTDYCLPPEKITPVTR